MKNYLLIILLAMFMFPNVTIASWWNPFSWRIWNKNNSVFNENKITPNDTEEIKILKQEIKDLKKQLNNSNNTNNNEINTSTQKVNTSGGVVKINSTSTSKSSSSLTATDQDGITPLEIFNVKNKVIGNNVTITWETNYPTESTITLIESVEKVYSSNNGLNTKHSVAIYGLVNKNEYNFKLTAKTEDKKRTDLYHGSFYVIEEFVAYLGEFDEDKCQTIIVMDSNGRLKNKQISIGLSAVSTQIVSYGNTKITTDSFGEVKYCDKPSVNQYVVQYLNYDDVVLKR